MNEGWLEDVFCSGKVGPPLKNLFVTKTRLCHGLRALYAWPYYQIRAPTSSANGGPLSGLLCILCVLCAFA
jgi:hypothetical protein